MKKVKGIVFLILAALVWGVAFVAQKASVGKIGTFTMSTTRFFLGGVSLTLISIVFDLIKKKKVGLPKREKEDKNRYVKNLFIGGAIAGCVLCLASNLQQYGLEFTTAGKSGFITALYIFFVPLFGLFFRKKPEIVVFLAAIIALVGFYFLCLGNGFGNINKGDLLTLAAGACFAVHILVVGKFSPSVDGIKFTAVQCYVCSFISMILMFAFEKPVWSDIVSAWLPIVYAGVASSGLGYMFQVIGQKDVNPSLASLIMSCESVVSVLAAVIILHNDLSTNEIIGCCIIFFAIIFAQLPLKKWFEKNRADDA